MAYLASFLLQALQLVSLFLLEILSPSVVHLNCSKLGVQAKHFIHQPVKLRWIFLSEKRSNEKRRNWKLSENWSELIQEFSWSKITKQKLILKSVVVRAALKTQQRQSLWLKVLFTPEENVMKWRVDSTERAIPIEKRMSIIACDWSWSRGVKRVVKRTKEEFNSISEACQVRGSLPEICSTSIVPRFHSNKSVPGVPLLNLLNNAAAEKRISKSVVQTYENLLCCRCCCFCYYYYYCCTLRISRKLTKLKDETRFSHNEGNWLQNNWLWPNSVDRW